MASVIIPNWNGKKFLRICLPTLKKQTFKDLEVIIVDNGSEDGSARYIKKYFSDFRVVELDKNYGFAKAVNIGIKKSLGELIILLNNDTKLDKDCIYYLVKAARSHRDVGMVAAKILNFYRPYLIDSAGDFVDSVGHANNIGMGEKDGPRFNKAGPCFLVCGGGSLFRKTLLNEVGLFDEDFFAYFEDVDLCLRAQLAGFGGWYEPKAVIFHIHKATSNRNKALTEYLQFRNMTMTLIKNFPKSLILRDFNWLKIILVNINTIRFFATQGYLTQALRAEGYILFNLWKIYKKRMKIQSKIKVSEEYIIENILPRKVTIFGLLKGGF